MAYHQLKLTCLHCGHDDRYWSFDGGIAEGLATFVTLGLATNRTSWFTCDSCGKSYKALYHIWTASRLRGNDKRAAAMPNNRRQLAR